MAEIDNGQFGYFLMGGKNSNGVSDGLWSGTVDPDTQAFAWTQVCGTGTNCTGPGAVEGSIFIASDGPIFLFGGAVGGEVNDITWAYSPSRAELRDHTCTDFGYVSGTLGCNSGCGFDESQCMAQPLCGDGIIQPSAGEECDGSVTGSSESCSSFWIGQRYCDLWLKLSL